MHNFSAGHRRIDGGKYAQTIIYDTEKRMIVVTMSARTGHYLKKYEPYQ